MHASLLFVSALAASAWAAPAFPKISEDAGVPDSVRSISDYFNLLATKVQESRTLAAPPTCDLSHLSLPAGKETPPPSRPSIEPSPLLTSPSPRRRRPPQALRGPRPQAHRHRPWHAKLHVQPQRPGRRAQGRRRASDPLQRVVRRGHEPGPGGVPGPRGAAL